MNRLHGALLAAVLLTAGALAARAPVSAGQRLGGHHCDHCGAVCLPTPERKTEKKHCWEVECKLICIPAIKWPWQSCCEVPKPGKVRTVKVLKKVEYECEHCGYRWEVQCAACKPQGN